MATTKIFKSGNSWAVRIPADMAYDRTDVELTVERVGDEIRIRPARRLVAISAITLAELRYGIESRPESREQNEKALERLLTDLVVAPFDGDAAVAYGQLRAGIPRDQRRKDALDKLIASHAVALGTVLVTNNEGDFSRYPRVTIENWTL